MGYRSYLKVGLIFFLILNSFIIFNIIQFEAIPTLMWRFLKRHAKIT